MGLKDGQGKWEAPGHQVYVGEYKADKRHGLGVCVGRGRGVWGGRAWCGEKGGVAHGKI